MARVSLVLAQLRDTVQDNDVDTSCYSDCRRGCGGRCGSSARAKCDGGNNKAVAAEDVEFQLPVRAGKVA